ncbi:asparaginase [Nisaea sediminum]|uniref:asparaginase n=1 Tax=Nisaea sediminum TaxID=2775867 RepID=UPI0018665450|nr:asparaginase [Nisaea sediminum]
MSPDSLAADDRIVRTHISDVDAAPLLIEVTRGDMVESVHRGIVSVVDASGKDVLRLGDVERPTYPRSAIKPLQTLPVIESGAADAFNLSEAEIALCCASHAGEPIHTDKVVPWLARLGLSVDDLECGPQLPYSEKAAHALIRAGTEPTRAHNNCSGKHSGMLTTAVHLGEPTKGYTAADHPVQTRLIELIGEMGGMDLSRTARGVDGCGIPVFGAPLRGIAYAMARFAAPDGLSPERAAACRRVAKACAANPLMLSGTGQFNSVVLAETGESCILKGGAEGYYTAAIPEKGLGVAIKIDDGAGRASHAAVLAVLVRLGVIDEAQKARIEAACSQEVRNWAGTLVGFIRPTPAF